MKRYMIIAFNLVFVFSFILSGCITINIVTPTPTKISCPPTSENTPVQTTPIPTKTYTPSPSATSTLTLTPTITSVTTQEPIQGTTKEKSICRLGPDLVYDVAKYIEPNRIIIIEGRDLSSNWYWIYDEGDSESCWMSAGLISVTQDISILPILTPIPSPRPTVKPTDTPTRKPPPPPTPTYGGFPPPDTSPSGGTPTDTITPETSPDTPSPDTPTNEPPTATPLPTTFNISPFPTSIFDDYHVVVPANQQWLSSNTSINI